MDHARWLLCFLVAFSTPSRVLCQSIAEILGSQGNLSTLLLALQKTGLAAALTGEVTVFAPTDAAFGSLLQSLGASAEDLLARPDLANILRLHVATGQITAETLASGAIVQSLEGARLVASIDGSTRSITLGDSRIVQSNLAAGSGIVHIIDKVLLPPQRRLLDGGSGGWQQSAWRVVVDGVMGGRSTGNVDFTGDAMVFSGNINLNGGGFSSVRRSYSIDLSSYAGVLLEFDSSTYKAGTAPLGLHLQLGQSSSSYSYAAAFAVPFSSTSSAERCKVFIPMQGFDRASRWGYECKRSCKLDASKVNALEVYALFQSGGFEVRLHSISTVEKAFDAPLPTAPSIPLDSGGISSMIQATIDSGGALYDKGYKELCLAMYETAARQIVAAAGPSGAIRALACAGLQQAASGTKELKAWVLRRAFDAILADLAGSDRVRESRYPSNVQGNWLPPRGDTGSPGACAGLADLSTSGQVSTASADATAAAATTTIESSMDVLSRFARPFTGMGISGWNDLGSSRVSDPKQCAMKCLRIASCKSFDYGARGSVAGECWLSTADRAIAGNAYTAWNLYDYYELSTTTGVTASVASSAITGATASGAASSSRPQSDVSKDSVGSLRGGSSEVGNGAAGSAGDGSSDAPGSLMWILLGAGVVGGIGLGVGGVCLYNRARTRTFSVAKPTEGAIVVVGQPVGSYADNPKATV